jgi:hypothetical protein
MSTLGNAIFDTLLVSYPLYQTSQLILSQTADTNTSPLISTPEERRLLRFWLVYGGLNLTESFGADGIPGFQLLKGAVLISMYSDVHSAAINDILLTRVCRQYLNVANRVKTWWNDSAVPKVEQISGGWFGTIKSKLPSTTGWW